MKVLVDGEVKELNIVTEGINWTEDFVAPGTRQEFKWNEDAEMYETTQEDFEWWEDVIANAQIVEDAVKSDAFKALDEDTKEDYYNLVNGEPDLDRCYELALDWLDEHKVK